ncbi:MAG: DUF3826 domain-containing protein [Opitutae bacterium]|nr:DUF3826 domain-containing protein [Opitutae bacterium]
MHTSRSLSRWMRLATLALALVGASVLRAEAPAAAPQKFEPAIFKRAAAWVGELGLTDPAQAERVRTVIATHLTAVRDWHNAHPYTTVPEGVNPATGKPLSKLDREMIADGAMPKTVHAALMAGLRADLTEAQVEAILDKYTIGKVAFTLKGYHAIVPDLTAEEEKVILGFLKQAREEAVDYKSMPQISAIFEIYKTKSEQYLISRGRDWKALFRAYVQKVQAEKAAKQAAPPAAPAKTN